MRRKSLYTAIGRFEHRTNSHGQICPVILLGGNEYILDLQEMALWTSLNWRIARKEEIPHLYEKTISRSGFTAERPLEACIHRLLMRGLLVCGTNTVRLSAKEFDIMRFLLQSGSRNLSKETILARVWGYDSDAVENHVEVYVGFLRKKLASIGSDIRIEAIRRMGYHLEVNEHDKETPP